MTTAPENATEPKVPARHRPSWCRLFPAGLLALYAAQCLWFIGTQSLTYDEPIHIKAGLDAWQNHRFEYAVDQAPLARLLATLPIARDAQVTQAANGASFDGILPDPAATLPAVRDASVAPAADGKFFDAILPNPTSVAWRARTVIMLLGIALGVFLWVTIRKLFSTAAANFALALFAFTPALIAHFSLVTTDGIITLMIFVTALQLARWNHDPSRRQTVLLGLALGLLLLAKMSAPPFFLLALVLVLIRKQDLWELRPWRWNWRAALIACGIALVILWGGHFFHVSRVTIKGGMLTSTSPNRRAFTRQVPFAGNISFFLPAGEYFEAAYAVIKHNKQGHQSYLLGRLTQRAVPWFYPLLIVLKWPTVILILSLAGFTGLARRRQLARFADFLFFPILMLLLAYSSRIGIGERHILVLYPFALVFCAALWNFCAEARRACITPPPLSLKAATYLLIGCVILNAIDTLRCAPGYLSYLNASIRPRQAYKIATDSNLDWGQGLLALRRYQMEHPDQIIHLAYFGSVNPAIYGIRSVSLAPDAHQGGTIVVSATRLSGQYLENYRSGYRWVLQYPIQTLLDGSLYVFSVPEK
jgi:hypothetical protein